MTKLTLKDCRDKISRIIGCGASSPKVASYANEAQWRLLNRANDPVGSWQRYRVCVNSSNCLTWPRQVMTIRSFWICNRPGRFVSEFYESIGYMEGGVGLSGGSSGVATYGGNTLIDQGTSCSFDNVSSSTTVPKKIQAVASDPSDNGKFITLRYLDSNGNRAYTSIDGVIQEGERIVLSTTGTLTAASPAAGQVFDGGLYHVVKDVTNFPVRLYEWDVLSSVQTKLLAVYEPSEVSPIYRSTVVPGLTGSSGCCSDSTSPTAITITARLQHIPVVVDNDPFIIGNLPALADMVQSILYSEKFMIQESTALEAKAERELDGEMAAYLGDGMITTIKTPDGSTWGASGIVNPCGGWGLWGGF